MSNLKSCSDKCSPGLYFTTNNEGEPVCANCESCLTCFALATNCTSCSSPRYLQNTTGTDNKICAEACTNPSEYADKFTNQCKKCNESCFSCYGPNIFQCTSCNQPFYYNELTNECALDCPFGTFKNDSTAFYVCSACNSTCKSCDGGTGSDCLSCVSGLFLDNRQCLLACSTPATYADTFAQKCSGCDTACLKCTGPLISQC